jgi:hypothetical protein
MKEPPSAKAAPARRDPLPPAGPECRLLVRYYRRMRPQRVYTLEVSNAKAAEGRVAGTIVLVRPIIPGAHVAPAESEMNLAQPNARASFYVTPLAKGSLPHAQVEVRQQGRTLQTIPVGMRAATQRRTWLLLALAFLLPAGVLLMSREDLFGKEKRARPLTQNAVEPMPKVGDEARAQPEPAQGARPMNNEDRLKAENEARAARGEPPIQGPQGPGRGPAPGQGPPPGRGGIPENAMARAGGGRPPDAPDVEAPQVDPKEAFRSNYNLSKRSNPVVYAITENVPEVPDNVEEKLPWVGGVTKRVALGAGTAYDVARALADNYLAFWLFVGLLLLVLMSWFTRRPIKGRRRGALFHLPASDGQAGGDVVTARRLEATA